MNKHDNFDDGIPVSISKLLPATKPVKIVNCSEHGDFESRNYFSNIWSDCPICQIEVERVRDLKRAEQDAAETKRMWELRLGRTGIPDRFKTRTFATYHAENAGQKRTLAYMIEYAGRLVADKKLGRSVILCGMPGTGKTHLAIGTALHLLAAGRLVGFTTVQRMIRRLKDSWRNGSEESETDVVNLLADPDLLIIDEIGVQFGSDFEKNFIFDLLNERYEKRKSTILLSNLTAVEIKKFLGERIYDRLKEDGGQVVSFDWESYRGKQVADKQPSSP